MAYFSVLFCLNIVVGNASLRLAIEATTNGSARALSFPSRGAVGPELASFRRRCHCLSTVIAEMERVLLARRPFLWNPPLFLANFSAMETPS